MFRIKAGEEIGDWKRTVEFVEGGNSFSPLGFKIFVVYNIYSIIFL